MNIVPITPEQPDDLPTGFDAFWAFWTRHEARKDALKAWNQLSPADQTAAIIGAATWRREFIARGVRFTPLGASWLRAERWTDELPDQTAGGLSSSHVPFTFGPVPAKATEIPEHVKAMLRKLTGRPA